MKAERPQWPGTVVCIASGPSLTLADCEAVHASGLRTVVVNTSFQRAPWATALYAMDLRWWAQYHEETKQFKGLKFSSSQAAHKYGAVSTQGCGWFAGNGNSGACAMHLAIAAGASRIILLGYDCQRTDGRAHWHGDHPAGLGNARSMPKWAGHFARVAAYARGKGVAVVNASAATALTCFNRGALGDELAAALAR